MPYERVSEAIAHFLNCFLGQPEGGGRGREEEPMVNGHSSSSRKKQKKKKSGKGRTHTGRTFIGWSIKSCSLLYNMYIMGYT